MTITGRRITVLSIFLLSIFALIGCESQSTNVIVVSATPLPIGSANPDYALAQATVNTGQSQLSGLALAQTQVALTMTQAVKDVLQATESVNQTQKAALNQTATIVSLNITQAVQTQQYLLRQTAVAVNATNTAMVSAATSTQQSFIIQVTQTAQALQLLSTQTVQAMQFQNTQVAMTQAVVNAYIKQTQQAILAETARPLTATPLALTQAAALSQEYDQEQQNFISQIVGPLIPFLAVVDLILFVLVVMYVWRGEIPVPPLLRRQGLWPLRARQRVSMIDAPYADYAAREAPASAYSPEPPASPIVMPQVDEALPPIDIVNASEPPYNHWIAEVEHQLASEGED